MGEIETDLKNILVCLLKRPRWVQIVKKYSLKISWHIPFKETGPQDLLSLRLVQVSQSSTYSRT